VGVIFAWTFAAVAVPSAALASNLFGALVGGSLEYLSMLLGIRALSLLALGLYAGSFLAPRGKDAPKRSHRAQSGWSEGTLVPHL
jgi:hypothetical protein